MAAGLDASRVSVTSPGAAGAQRVRSGYAGEQAGRRAGRVRCRVRGRDAMKPGFQRVQTRSIPGFTASGPARDPRPMVLMMPVLPGPVSELAASPGQNGYPASITRRRAELARLWRELSKTAPFVWTA